MESINVYKDCPSFENDRFLLRRIEPGDCTDLLAVYSDERAVPFFNGDNCNGDDFHYETAERMRQALDFWEYSYRNGWFVRWTVLDKTAGRAVGTIELFHRTAEDYFDRCALLRLDLASGYEDEADIESILSLIVPRACGLFDCDFVAAKAVPEASERRKALTRLGFRESVGKLRGSDGTEYGFYWEWKEH